MASVQNQNPFMKDLMYQYMMHMTVKDMQSLSLVNKDANQVYHSFNFWRNKLIRDQLPIYDCSVEGYQKIQQAIEIKNSLVHYNKMSFIFDHLLLSQVMPFYHGVEDKEQYMIINKKLNQVIVVSKETTHIEVSNEQIDQLLTDIFYHYPTIQYHVYDRNYM